MQDCVLSLAEACCVCMLVAEAAQALLLPTKLSAKSSVVSVSNPFSQHLFALCVHVWRAGHIREAL